MKDEILKYISKNAPKFELVCIEKTTSTNDEIRKYADGGTCVLIAKRQTAGRGRKGRSFISPEGGLYMSIIRKLGGSAEEIFSYMPMAGAGVCRAAEQVFGLKPTIKWSNDVLIADKKICGILAESYISGNDMYLVLGVGVNIKPCVSDIVPTAAAIGDFTDTDGKFAQFAAKVIENLIEIDPKSGISEYYRSRCGTIGKEITVTMGNKALCGICTEIDNDGALILKTSDGVLHRIISGEATLRTNC